MSMDGETINISQSRFLFCMVRVDPTRIYKKFKGKSA